jgi:hypothetical protein
VTVKNGCAINPFKPSHAASAGGRKTVSDQTCESNFPFAARAPRKTRAERTEFEGAHEKIEMKAINMVIAPRIFFSILAAILSFVLLAIYFPFVAGFIWFLGIGAAILFTIFKSLEKGFIGVNLKYKFAVYERRNNPIAFWFFVFVGVCFGILGCVSSIFFLLHKFPKSNEFSFVLRG